MIKKTTSNRFKFIILPSATVICTAFGPVTSWRISGESRWPVSELNHAAVVRKFSKCVSTTTFQPFDESLRLLPGRLRAMRVAYMPETYSLGTRDPP